jgi:hypothetical protein
MPKLPTPPHHLPFIPFPYVYIHIKSPRKNLHHAIPTTTNHPPAILAPYNSTHALAPHQPVGRNLLRAGPFLQAPEPETGVVARADEFPAVGREREGRDGGGVGEHVVCALT